jgi:dienelactone hydrolase
MKRTTLNYRDGDVELKGILLSDDEARGGQRPGVVLFPDARGIGDHALECAGRLAVLGFVVLVADLYGGGTTARDIPHARELMGQLRSDVVRWRARGEMARQALAQQGNVDTAKIAAIGYCFGGTTALELGRSGAALAAIVSFHGGLANARPEDTRNIKAKVLVCHGAADTLVSMTQLATFEEEMSRTNVDWQVHVYGGAGHGFTNPEADGAGVPELAYHPAADRRSWSAMLGLLDEAFGVNG